MLTILLMCISGRADASNILDGQHLSLWWGIPFLGVILSLAICPLLMPRLWGSHYGKITTFWTIITLCTICSYCDVTSSLIIVVTTLISHYLPFIVMIAALYIVASNIHLDINVPATPLTNTVLLIIGTLLTNIIGTTGAVMLLIQPLININKRRQYKQHSLIFFIFMVGNIGGCLTPLGDPPLFLGFLNGVSFTWLIKNMWLPLIVVTIPLITIYYFIDHYFVRFKEPIGVQVPINTGYIKIAGRRQFIFVAMIIVTIIINALWSTRRSVDIIAGHPLLLKDIIRDVSLLVIAVASYTIGHSTIRQKNNFSWHPLIEISKIFAAIFLTAIPVIAILQAGHSGALHEVIKSITHNDCHNPSAYFWFTGLLSAFLDNAPTYLIFFNIAGGNAEVLMTNMPSVLVAISSGAVFMGSLSYIGNAPNFMVKSIAELENIRMPSFFGYILWSCSFLLPVFILLNYLLF